MQDSQLLSAFHEPASPPEPAVEPPALVFDACHVGVVLRAVLFVETVVAVGALYGADSVVGWLVRTSTLTGGALPAVLLWLLAACSLKRALQRLTVSTQYVAGVALGAVAGVYGCGVLAMVGMAGPASWLASAASGSLLAAVLVAALVLRARGTTPAATSARLAQLQARIRPHFLFNTLNSAIALVRAEPAKAEAMLEDLSDLFRHALQDRGESVTLADEVALARRYLAIEQVRFGDRLRIEWAIDPLANGARLPPLLLQPLVENAVHHGVEPSATGASVRISTQRRGSVVVIKVTNSVPGGPGANGSGVALDNVRSRLSLLHDVQSKFQSGLKDGVFQVRIEVPL
jgi:two-component system sensor histidine kinase AlgZ